MSDLEPKSVHVGTHEFRFLQANPVNEANAWFDELRNRRR
jgi:hypothetical protein